MSTRTKMTAEEFLALPEDKPYAELVAGEVRRKMSPALQHQRIVVRLLDALREHRATRGGETIPDLTTRFPVPTDDEVRLPDVSWYADPSRLVPGTQLVLPDLAIEVRSPGQALRDLREKCRFYRENGVVAAWLIDPDRRCAEVWDEGHEGTTLDEDGTLAFQGFALRLAEALGPAE